MGNPGDRRGLVVQIGSMLLIPLPVEADRDYSAWRKFFEGAEND